MSDYTTEHKVPPYDVRRLTNADPTFYELVGPLLSRREIVAELGGPVWDDDGKTWFIATSEDGVLGMVAVASDTVCSFYVTPQSRGKLIGHALLMQATEWADKPLRAVATESSAPVFELHGFQPTGERGRYLLMRRG